MALFSRKKIQQQLQLLDNTDLERTYGILIAVIIADEKQQPKDLTKDEQQVFNELNEIFNNTRLFEHRYKNLNKSHSLSTCECQENFCPDRIGGSDLEANIFFRNELLDYAIWRIDEKLDKGNFADLQEKLELNSQKHFFQVAKVSLNSVTDDVKECRDAVKSFEKVMGGIFFGLAIGSVLTVAAIGFAIATTAVISANILVPPLALVTKIIAGGIVGAVIGGFAGIIPPLACFLPVSAICDGLGSLKMSKSVKKLSQKTREKINKTRDDFEKNPQGVNKPALNFAKTMATAKFGFFAKLPRLKKIRKQAAQPSFPSQQIKAV